MKLDIEKFKALKKKIENGEDIWITIISSSMAPLIKKGERVRVCRRENQKIFDIVIYHHRDGRLICHYIWGRSELNPKNYLLRAFSNQVFDLPVDENCILGYLPDKRINWRWKVFLFFKFLQQKLRGGVLISCILLLVGCSKMNYVLEQTAGQVALLSSREKNEKVLKDSTISSSQKKKIRQIQNYKRFFFQYLSKEPTNIYNKTVFLKEKAVTHLVVASNYNKVKPIEHCFLFAGCFPYISFFKKKSALNFQKKMEKKNFYTYIRPVYAYSTIGYFDDPILSSFFYYGEFELAELVFHELFHSIFYLKNKVSFNENLANYFSRKMAFEYFKNRTSWLKNKKDLLRKNSKVRAKITQLANSYKKKLQFSPPPSREQADQRLKEFIEKELHPSLEKTCNHEGLKPCFPLKRKWNNASLSAFLTYQDHLHSIEKLHQKTGLSLKEFLQYLEEHGVDALE